VSGGTAPPGGYRTRKAVDILGRGLAVLSIIVAVIPLGAMLVYVLAQGGSSLNLTFFTSLPKPTGELGGGMLNAIAGTLMLMALASVVGLPVGILSGIFLARTNNPFATLVRFVTDIVAGTPSIVAGVVAYVLVVLPFHKFSAVAGGCALGILMFPTVARTTEESIRLIPPAIREAGLAVGLPEWKTMLRVVLPTAASGIITAVMLGIARVSGETAPLFFTALGNDNLQLSPFGQVGALPLQIWYYATSPYEDLHRQAWEGAFVLFLLIVVLNLGARLLARRLAGGASRF